MIKYSEQKQLVEERSIWFTLSGHSPLVREVVRFTLTQSINHEGHCLLARRFKLSLLSCIAQDHLLRAVPPTVVWALLCQLAIKTIPLQAYLGQSNPCSFSVEFASSKGPFGCVKLTIKTKHHTDL